MINMPERGGLELERVAAGGTGQLVVPHGLRVDEHEVEVARLLTDFGFNVTFRALVMKDGVKNPDVEIDGKVWEIKSPKGGSENSTIANQFRRGKKQSTRLILDLTRCKLDDSKATNQAKKRFFGQTLIHELIIVTKQKQAIYCRIK